MTNLLFTFKNEESLADLYPKKTFPLPFKFDTPFAPKITFLLPVEVVSVTASFPIITLSSPVKPLAVAYPIEIFLEASCEDFKFSAPIEIFCCAIFAFCNDLVPIATLLSNTVVLVPIVPLEFFAASYPITTFCEANLFVF